MSEIIIKNINQINKGAEQFLDVFNNHYIIAFYGDIGVGKTTFIKAICKLLGVKSNVTSPSFAIVNEYQDINSKTIYHFDLYRIKSTQELLEIGFEEYLYSDCIIFIEWPEIAKNLLPKNTLSVKITDISNERHINY